MISGTYILTDTINRAFTTLFTESYAGTDAVVTGRGLDISIDGEAPPAPPVDASLLDTVRGVDGCRARDGNRARRAQHEDPHARGGGRQLRGRTDVRIRHRHGSGARPVQSAERPRGPLACDGRRGRHRRRDGGRPGLRGRRHGRDLDPAAEALVRARRRRAVRQPRQPRECELRGVHDPGGAGAPRSRRSVRRDLGRGERRHHGGRARRSHRARAAGDGEGRERDRGGRRAGRRGERVHGHLPLLPARVRRYRALRRRVRHLQHVLDHGCAANARVRDVADDRRVAASDSRLGDPRVAGHRLPGVARRSRVSAFCWPRGSRGSSALSGSSFPPRTASSRCARWSSRSSSAWASRSSPACSPPSARRACRRSRRCAKARRFRSRGSRRYMPWIAGLVVVVALVVLARAMFTDELGTADRLLSIAAGVLLLFLGVAMLSSHVVRPLAAISSPIGRWAAFVFTALFWPFWLLPYWLVRYGAWGPGSALGRVGRLRRRHADQSPRDARRSRDVAAPSGDEVGAGVAGGVPGRCSGSCRCPNGRRERAPKPEPDGSDRSGADDRDRARLVHRDADERDEGVEPRGDRGADRRRLRRDVARRLHAVRRRGRRRARRVPRARGRDERALGRRPGRRRDDGGRRHRARHDRRRLRLRLARGRRERARHARHDEGGRQLELRGGSRHRRGRRVDASARPPSGRRRSPSWEPSSRRPSTR